MQVAKVEFENKIEIKGKIKLLKDLRHLLSDAYKSVNKIGEEDILKQLAIIYRKHYLNLNSM